MMGVILAAGQGRRMGPLGVRMPKSCLPICNRPLLHYQLDHLLSMGINYVVIVVGYLKDRAVQAAESYIAGAPRHGLRLVFVEQPEQRGIAHALQQTASLVDEQFVVILGDTYFIAGDVTAPWRILHESACDAVLSIRTEPEADLIRKECTVEFDAEGRLLRIEEKPQTPWNDLKPCGMYFFTRKIFDAIDKTPRSALRGEVEITDAIQTLVRHGGIVRRAGAVRWDKNLNVPADYLLCNRVALRVRGVKAAVADDVTLPPGVTLNEAVIGRSVTIDRGAELNMTVVLDDAVVRSTAPYCGSILGRDFILTTSHPLPSSSLAELPTPSAAAL